MLNAVTLVVGMPFTGNTNVPPGAIGIPSVAEAVPPVGLTYKVFTNPVFDTERYVALVVADLIIAELVTVTVEVGAVNVSLFPFIVPFVLIANKPFEVASYLASCPSSSLSFESYKSHFKLPLPLEDKAFPVVSLIFTETCVSEFAISTLTFPLPSKGPVILTFSANPVWPWIALTICHRCSSAVVPIKSWKSSGVTVAIKI